MPKKRANARLGPTTLTSAPTVYVPSETQVLEQGYLASVTDVGSGFSGGVVFGATIPTDVLGSEVEKFFVRGKLAMRVDTDAAAGTTTFELLGNSNSLLTRTGAEVNNALTDPVAYEWWSLFSKAGDGIHWACEESTITRIASAGIFTATAAISSGRDFVGSSEFPLVFEVSIDSTDANTVFADFNGFIELMVGPNSTHTEW